MKRALVALVLALVAAAPATAAARTAFTVTIRNGTTNRVFAEGVLAVLPSTATPNALLSVGPAPRVGDQYDTYYYAHQNCDLAGGGEDDGNAALLISRWGLVNGTNAWVVPSLAAGASTTITFWAEPGQVLSYVARVNGFSDDVVMMNAVGNTADTTIDLFDASGFPLPRVLFWLSGYDVNSSTANGALGECTAVCPPPAANCFVAVGNTSTTSTGGGTQATPYDFDTPAWSRVETGYTTDAMALGDVQGTTTNELVLQLQGSDWSDDIPVRRTGKVVVLTTAGALLYTFVPAALRDFMGFPLIEELDGNFPKEYVVQESLDLASGGSVYAMPGNATGPGNARWIHTPRDWPGLWNMGASSGQILSELGREVVVPAWDGVVQVLRARDGAVIGTYDAFTAFGEGFYGHVAIADVDGIPGDELVMVGGRTGRVIVVSPALGTMPLVWASNPAGAVGQLYAFGSGPAVGDIDGDGTNEIVVALAGAQPQIRAYNVGRADCKYRWTGTGGADYTFTSPALADVDADGRVEVVVMSNDGKLSVLGTQGITAGAGCVEGAYEVRAHQAGAGDSAWFTPVLSNVTGGAAPDIIVATYSTLEILEMVGGSLRVVHRAVDPAAAFFPYVVVERGTATNGATIYASGWFNGGIYAHRTPAGSPVPSRDHAAFMGSNERRGLTADTSCSSCTGGACAQACVGGCSQVCNDPGCDCYLECSGAGAQCTPSCINVTTCDATCIGVHKCEPTCENSNCSFNCQGAIQHCLSDCRTGSNCEIDCSNVSKCQTQCRTGSSCNIDCRGAALCKQIDCTNGSDCLLNCAGSPDCGLRSCTGGSGALSCPNNVYVCNRACP